jgi:hypothetical protein
LELLDSRLSAIGAWYEDSSWADGIQQQLAAIEQSFATGMQQQQQQQQQFGELEIGEQLDDGESSLQAAAAAAAACSSELLWSHSKQEVHLPDGTQQQQQQEADAAAALPAAKAFVTTPSGHVSMISSRRGTQVMSALDVAMSSSSSRRGTVVDSMSGAGRRSRPLTCSGISTMRATAEAAAAAADDCAVGGSSCGSAAAGGAATSAAAVPARHKARRSTWGAVARAACAFEQQQQQQQQQLACEQQQQQPGTLLVLSEAAQRLSAEQEEEEQVQQQQQLLWQDAAVADGPSGGSNEPLMLLDDSISADGDEYGAADGFEDCFNQLPAEQEGGWSPAAALVDAMQQAALAVLTQQQQPLAPIAEHEQLQGGALATAPALQQRQQQQQPSPAPEAVAPEVEQGQEDTQQLESSAADGEDDAFWDAEEAEAAAAVHCEPLCSGTDQLDIMPSGPAAASQQQQQQQQCGSLQLLKQQLAEQRARTQQLQQQLELEHSQSGGGLSLSDLHNAGGCSSSADVAADVQQQQQRRQSSPMYNALGEPIPMVFTFEAPEAATQASSYSCVTEWGSVAAEPQHASTAGAVVMSGAAGSKGAGDAEQQLLECRAALAAQHAACEELRQQNQQLVAALQIAGCSV